MCGKTIDKLAKLFQLRKMGGEVMVKESVAICGKTNQKYFFFCKSKIILYWLNCKKAVCTEKIKQK